MNDLGKRSVDHLSALSVCVGVGALCYIFIGGWFLGLIGIISVAAAVLCYFKQTVPNTVGSGAAGLLAGMFLAWILGKVVFWIFAIAIVAVGWSLFNAVRSRQSKPV